MSMIDISVAAATAVVGYDMMTGDKNKQVSYDRSITDIGLCGSAAAGDSEIELFVGTISYGKFKNLATGYPTNDHMISVEIPVPAGEQINAIVTDAAGTNPLNLKIALEDEF